MSSSTHSLLCIPPSPRDFRRPRLRRPLAALVAEPRGSAAVELALTAPFLVLLCMGIIDFGNVAYTLMQVNAAAHAGAMYAFANPTSCTTSGITSA